MKLFFNDCLSKCEKFKTFRGEADFLKVSLFVNFEIIKKTTELNKKNY